MIFNRLQLEKILFMSISQGLTHLLLLCRDMAKPNNSKNHVFENVDFVVKYYCTTRKQLYDFFKLCLEPANCTNIKYFFAFIVE